MVEQQLSAAAPCEAPLANCTALVSLVQKGQVYTKLQRAQGDNVRSVDDDTFVLPTDDSLGKKP